MAGSDDALANMLISLEQNPYDISLHAQHIQLAIASRNDEHINGARELFRAFWAVGDEVWIPFIEAKEKEAGADMTALQEVVVLYELARDDYLSIPLLLKFMQFLTDTSKLVLGQADNPQTPEDPFSIEWTRNALRSITQSARSHLTQSHVLWDAYRDWELEQLEAAAGNDAERYRIIDLLQEAYLGRLKEPHSTHEETFQSYSSFVTNHMPPTMYEATMVSASKAKAQAVKAWSRREQYELPLASSGFSPEAYAYSISLERKQKNPDLDIVSTLYERAIAETAKRRFHGDTSAEAALAAFWNGYSDFLRTCEANDSTQMKVFARGARSVPRSGEFWARYMRFSESTESDEETVKSPAELYDSAMSTKLVQRDVDQMVTLTLARAGYERRRIEKGISAEEAFTSLVRALEDGISTVRQASKEGDSRYRLERFLADFYTNLAESPESAIAIWESAAKHYKTSYIAWTTYADLLIKQSLHDDARKVFKDVCNKNLDWPEAVFEAWMSFEHLYGSIEDIQTCLDKLQRSQEILNTRRAREAEKASTKAAQVIAEAQPATVPVAEVQQLLRKDDATSMDVDMPGPSDDGKKRKADDMAAMPDEAPKKAKTENPAPLKRDRENCTVFVADLPNDATEDQLKGLFKDCGSIREIKLSKVANAHVATVEFTARDAVPAALTKDKKRLNDQELSVHLAWKSTLYVTNFPEKTDDAAMRELFGAFGPIFDVRWPSKKFKDTRRFCYVQFMSPDFAQSALSLHGKEVEPGLKLSVYISNPERRKERTDANANEREVYVAGLSKFMTSDELLKVFKTYGDVKEVRMQTDDAGHSKGFAFVEFMDEDAARKALSANNMDIKNRRIAVTLADGRVRSKPQWDKSTGHSRAADIRSRSLRIKNLPSGVQEGLLHQAIEKVLPIKRVEVFEDKREAIVEFNTASEAGKALLLTEPIDFNGQNLTFLEMGAPGASAPKAGGLFVPRAAASRPRAGLGKNRNPHPKAPEQTPRRDVQSSNASTGSDKGRSQDDFRKLLS